MSTPESPIIQPSFQEQLCNWLTEMHLAFELISILESAPEIRIMKGEFVVLTLIAVPLESWIVQSKADNTHKEHWQKQIQHLLDLRQEGFKCVLIWEDYWIKSPDIVKSRLNAMLGNSQKIAARLTVVRRIDQKAAENFLEKNHLNGSVSSKTRYGLFLPKRYYLVLEAYFEHDCHAEELLVAVATFSAPRVFARADGPFRSFEMLRFASLLHTNVSGGLDKLLTAFTREKQPDDIMTYADREWSEGEGYARLGFERISETLPMPFYLQMPDMTRRSKSLGGELLIYNAGSIKFVKTFKSE